MDIMGGFRDDSPLARIARVVVPGACYVGRSLARRDHKRKVQIPKLSMVSPELGEIDLMEKFYVL